jgi:hypothetical protein
MVHIHLCWEEAAMRTVTTAMLVVTLLFAAGYGQQKNSPEEMG